MHLQKFQGTSFLKQVPSVMQVDPKFIVWCPYSAEREYALYRN